MSDAPKLTPEQVQRIWEIGGYPKPDFDKALQDMGLIAPEPVDALREIVEDLWHISVGPKGEAVTKMTAELRRRGVTLAKPELTREMVREAIHEGQRRMHGGTGTVSESFLEGVSDALHAALTEGQSK